MTKEDMENLLKAREKRIGKEKQKEKQNMELQVERLLVLIENMKEDLEIKQLISDAKLSKHIKSFYCYERENKMGFHERRNDVFLQDLFIVNLLHLLTLKWRLLVLKAKKRKNC